MREDGLRWDDRYTAGLHGLEGPPLPYLVAWLPFLPRGRALDLAAGCGRHSVYLAQHGFRVDAFDISLVGLTRLAGQARAQDLPIRGVVVDLDEVIPPPATYDLIVNTYYLNRRLLSQLPGMLTPGGALIVESALYDPVVDPRGEIEHRLRFGELALAFPGLDIAHCEELPARPPRRKQGVCRMAAFRPSD